MKLVYWKEGREVSNNDVRGGPIFHYRVISRKTYDAVPAIQQKKSSGQPNAQTTELVLSNPTQPANGHMARENGRFGSFPKHDKYDDEATGQERDYEEYVEYAANYE